MSDDRTVVHFRSNEMNRTPRDFYARGNRLLVRVKPFEAWQQRRVDVDHAVAPVLDEARRHQPHEARKRDKFDFVSIERMSAARLRRPRASRVLLWSMTTVRESVFHRPRHAGRVRPVGGDQHDFGRIVGRP